MGHMTRNKLYATRDRGGAAGCRSIQRSHRDWGGSAVRPVLGSAAEVVRCRAIAEPCVLYEAELMVKQSAGRYKARASSK